MKLIPSHDDSFRIMVVDDSAVIRGFLTRTLEGEQDFKVVSSVGNGQMAVDALPRVQVDVIVLDIEMPVMDGLIAIPKLLAANPNVKIVMASTLTVRGAEVSMKALSLGASDYVAKPTSTQDAGTADDFNRDLVAKVRVLAQAARRSSGRARLEPRSAPPSESIAAPTLKSRLYGGGPVVLRQAPPAFSADVIAIGSSTGGPQALFEVLASLKGVAQPIFITQHMPATFTTILAQHIRGGFQ
jgi:two-component system chemotaxis response regulator CheB